VHRAFFQVDAKDGIFAHENITKDKSFFHVVMEYSFFDEKTKQNENCLSAEQKGRTQSPDFRRERVTS
jgi:hypothetical protein